MDMHARLKLCLPRMNHTLFTWKRVASIFVNSCGYPLFCRSIGKKLSTLLYTDGEEDWSDLGLEKSTSSSALPSSSQSKPPTSISGPPKKRTSLPAATSKPEVVNSKEEVKKEVEEITNFVKTATRTPGGGGDGYGEGVPVLNRKTSAPVMPYGSPRGPSEEKEVPAVRRKSSELSTSMKSRLEAFTKQQQEEADKAKARAVEPDETFREKLQAFRKISEAKAEDEMPKGPKPPLSYKTLIGNNFGVQQSNNNSLHSDHENSASDHEDNDVDQLLDDALEESYRSVLEDENEKVKQKLASYNSTKC